MLTVNAEQSICEKWGCRARKAETRSAWLTLDLSAYIALPTTRTTEVPLQSCSSLQSSFYFLNSATTKCLLKHNLPQSPNSTRAHRKEPRAGQRVDSHYFLLSYFFRGKAASKKPVALVWALLKLCCKSSRKNVLDMTSPLFQML